MCLLKALKHPSSGLRPMAFYFFHCQSYGVMRYFTQVIKKLIQCKYSNIILLSDSSELWRRELQLVIYKESIFWTSLIIQYFTYLAAIMIDLFQRRQPVILRMTYQLSLASFTLSNQQSCRQVTVRLSENRFGFVSTSSIVTLIILFSWFSSISVRCNATGVFV